MVACVVGASVEMGENQSESANDCNCLSTLDVRDLGWLGASLQSHGYHVTARAETVIRGACTRLDIDGSGCHAGSSPDYGEPPA